MAHETEHSHLLTVSDVAGQLNVSKMTVYRLIHAGEIQALHIGRSFRIGESAVENYLERAVVEAEPAEHQAGLARHGEDD